MTCLDKPMTKPVTFSMPQEKEPTTGIEEMIIGNPKALVYIIAWSSPKIQNNTGVATIKQGRETRQRPILAMRNFKNWNKRMDPNYWTYSTIPPLLDSGKKSEDPRPKERSGGAAICAPSRRFGAKSHVAAKVSIGFERSYIFLLPMIM